MSYHVTYDDDDDVGDDCHDHGDGDGNNDDEDRQKHVSICTSCADSLDGRMIQNNAMLACNYLQDLSDVFGDKFSDVISDCSLHMRNHF